jgi:hypothetical protein
LRCVDDFATGNNGATVGLGAELARPAACQVWDEARLGAELTRGQSRPGAFGARDPRRELRNP